MPPRVNLELFYDIGSPFTYLAYEVLLRYEGIWNLDLHLRPVSRQQHKRHINASVSYKRTSDELGWGIQDNRK
jgi:2-hydroxychromene-2-carboxylate isomerase